MKTWKIFNFEEPDDNGGGGGERASALDLLGGVTEAGQTDDTQTDDAQTDDVPDAPVSPKPFDPNEFAKQFGESFARSLPAAKKDEAPPLTPEEAKKLLRVWEPDDDFLAKFDNLETRREMLLKLRDGFVGQGDAIAQYRLQEAIQGIHQQYAPVLSYVQQQMVERQEQEFYTEYPVLKNEKLKPLIMAVAKDMQARGEVSADSKENFKRLAAGVESVIKVSNPDFTLKTPASSTSSPTRNSAGRIPSTTSGSGGGGGGKAPAPTGPRAIQILGKVR